MKSKALSILTSTALALGPVGTTAIASGSAFADDNPAGNPVYSDVLNGYPRQARLLISQYQTKSLTADQLRTLLYQLVSGKMISAADYDRLVLALDTGVFDCIPVVNVEAVSSKVFTSPEYDELEALIEEFEEAQAAGLPLPDYKTNAQPATASSDTAGKQTSALNTPGATSASKGLIPIGPSAQASAASGEEYDPIAQAPVYTPIDTSTIDVFAPATEVYYPEVDPTAAGQTLSANEVGRLPVITKSDSGVGLTADTADAISGEADAAMGGVSGTPEVGEALPAEAGEPSYGVPVNPEGDAAAANTQPANGTAQTVPQTAPQTQAQPEKVLVIPSGGTYTPVHYSTNTTVEAFIATIGEQAREIAQENNLYASVMIAQAILESGSGTSELSKAPNFNLFGIKGDYNGNSVRMMTQEDDGTGTRYSIRAAFRQYDSYQSSLEDYADLLRNGLYGFYHGAWKSEAPTPAAACDYLQGRYATATDYSANLQNLIATYNLTRFDNPLPYEPASKILVQSTSKLTGQPLVDENGRPVMEERTMADLTADAVSHLGTPYVWGGSNERTGFDCSGLVQHAYGEALGVSLPRTTYYQWLVGEDVAFSDLHPGDLLFFANGTDVHHVAIYLGDGYYIHAPRSGDVVRVTAMEDYMPTFAKRIIPTKPVGTTSSVKLPTIEKQVVRVPNELAGEIDKQLQSIIIYSEEQL